MRRQRLREQRPSRHREVVRHRHDLELVIERGRDDLDHLPHREHLFVADVEHLARRGVGLVDGEQHRVREVLGVAVMVQREAVVGDDDALAGRRAPAARSTTPAARAGTARTRTGSGSARRRDGARTPPPRCARCGSPSRPRPVPSTCGRVLGHRHRQARRVEQPGVHPALVRGDAADRHERARRAPRDAAIERSRPYIATTTSNVCPSSARCEIRVVVRIGVQVLDRVRRLGALVRAAVQDRRRRDRARRDRARSGCRSVRSRRSPAHARPSRGAYRRTLTRSAHRHPPPAVRPSRRARRDPASGPPRRGARLRRRLGQRPRRHARRSGLPVAVPVRSAAHARVGRRGDVTRRARHERAGAAAAPPALAGQRRRQPRRAERRPA